jgi:putative intracellular protease/amidase
MKKTIYLYVQDTLADWEYGYAAAELNSGRFFKTKGERIPVKTAAVTKDPITTIGGITITPDTTLDEVNADTSAMLILIGGDTWQDPKHQAVINKARELLDAGEYVAAICGATGALAAAGLLDNRSHTSNGLGYLGMVAPNYKGKEYYKEGKAIADGYLITAGSAGSLQFARYILATLDVFSPDALEAWYNYFETGQERYFFELMQKLPQ